MEGDYEANFLHYAIQKLHWSPSVLDEWFESDGNVKAFYYASTRIKAEAEEKEAKKMKKGAKRK